jgi:hypothetical protein
VIVTAVVSLIDVSTVNSELSNVADTLLTAPVSVVTTEGLAFKAVLILNSPVLSTESAGGNTQYGAFSALSTKEDNGSTEPAFNEKLTTGPLGWGLID